MPSQADGGGGAGRHGPPQHRLPGQVARPAAGARERLARELVLHGGPEGVVVERHEPGPPRERKQGLPPAAGRQS